MPHRSSCAQGQCGNGCRENRTNALGQPSRPVDRAGLGQVTGKLVAVLCEKSGGDGAIFADDIEIALDNPPGVLQGNDAQDFGWRGSAWPGKDRCP